MKISKPIVGHKYVKYGLIKPSEIQKSGLFSVDDDDDASKKLKEEQHRARVDKKTQEKLKEALEQDPLIFEYDGIKDEMKKAEKRKAPKKKEEDPRPKYVQKLLWAAEERERSNNVLYQRKLYRELEEDRKLYGEETEKFLTASYKRQLEENRKYEEEEQKQLEEEQKNDISKKGQTAFCSYYRNILDKQNLALGGVAENNTEKVDENNNQDDNQLTGQKRSRSEEEEFLEKERDRKRRNRERAEIAAEEAEKIRVAREESQKKKIEQLQVEYSKKKTDEAEVLAARERYLERQKLKRLEREKLKNETNENDN